MNQTNTAPQGKSLLESMQEVIDAHRAKLAAQAAASPSRPVTPVFEPLPASYLLTVDQLISRPRANSTGWSYVATESEAQAASHGIYARWPVMPYGTGVQISHDRGAWRVSWRVWNAD